MHVLSFFRGFIVVMAIGQALVACASSPQRRAEDFHDWVHHRGDNVAKREVVINRLDTPPTCWSLTQPKSRIDVIVVEPVDCDAHRDVLQDP